MGFERNAAALLLKLRADGVELGRVLTLGRQDVYLDPASFERLARRLGLSEEQRRAGPPAYADDLLRAMGATSVEAMDFSDYQGAARLHDLNAPVPAEWHEQFDLIVDGGTLEHIFNVPVALASCMQMLKPGGRFVAVTIANNWCGHGFYQFSPELFYRVFAPDAGFSIVEMYAADEHGERHYAVADPAAVGGRVQLWSCDPMYLLVHARRDSVRPVLTTPPNQADYVSDWATPSGSRRQAKRASWKEWPAVRQLLGMRARRYWRRQRRDAVNNRRHFTPVVLRL